MKAPSKLLIILLIGTFVSSCASLDVYPRPYYLTTSSTNLAKDTCSTVAKPIAIKMEGEILPLEYKKQAIISVKGNESTANERYFDHLMYEANKACANEIILINVEKQSHVNIVHDDPNTIRDESLNTRTIFKKEVSGIAIYNPNLTDTTPVSTLDYSINVEKNLTDKINYTNYINSRAQNGRVNKALLMIGIATVSAAILIGVNSSKAKTN